MPSLEDAFLALTEPALANTSHGVSDEASTPPGAVHDPEEVR